MGPAAHILPDGDRLHLQHGPIDLVIAAEGERQRAYEAAVARFETLLEELVKELPLLRRPLGPGSTPPSGATAKRMYQATHKLHSVAFLTPMAAVAGAVADEILQAMRAAACLSKAYVNNGGDIALHLAGTARFTTLIADHRGATLGRIQLTAADKVAGIATSGRHGRSLSLGIADSVTVLAGSAAAADAAATLIANAVDLPGHPAIRREKASARVPESDLGDRDVVTDCAPLSDAACQTALSDGLARAQGLRRRDAISGAALFLQGRVATTQLPTLTCPEPEVAYA